MAYALPDPILDSKELDTIDALTEEYEKFHKAGPVTALANKAGKFVGDKVPEVVKDKIEGLKGNVSEAEFMKQALVVVAQGFKELETRASSLTVSKETVLNRISKENENIDSYEAICLARGYEIEKALNLKDIQDLLYAAVQGGATGAFGFVGIVPNFVLSTFFYFRAVQSIALHYGYDVKEDPRELEIASQVMMYALNPNIEKGAETMTGLIGKMMIMTQTTALKQGLNKTYADMASKGGVQLIYVQIRALANKAAQNALDKAGKKGLEKTIYSEMLEQLGKFFTKTAGKKVIPVLGAAIGALFDTAYMARVLKYSKMVYHKRFLLEKEQRIHELTECGTSES